VLVGGRAVRGGLLPHLAQPRRQIQAPVRGSLDGKPKIPANVDIQRAAVTLVVRTGFQCTLNRRDRSERVV